MFSCIGDDVSHCGEGLGVEFVVDCVAAGVVYTRAVGDVALVDVGAGDGVEVGEGDAVGLADGDG